MTNLSKQFKKAVNTSALDKLTYKQLKQLERILKNVK